MLTHHALEMATGGAIKTTRGIQKAALDSFEKECEYLKSLVHKNIVHHIATVIEPNSKLPILVMELMDCSLKKYLESRNNQQLQILYQISLFSNIAKGLAFLHSRDLIHRDICDDNILLHITDDVPVAKISDLGMSRILPLETMSQTLTGLGHRQVYLPPEAMDEPYHYTHTLDIYSFGVLSVQIIQVKTKIRNKDELHAMVEEIPEVHVLKEIVRSCLSEDKRRRPRADDIIEQIG